MNAELFNALTDGIAIFAYIKKNGELRKAVGTLNARIIAQYAPNTTVEQLTIADNTNRYFDLEVGGWRRVADNGAQATLFGTAKDIA